MDYQTELKRLQEGGNYWKPKAGQYKVKALSELEEAEPYQPEGEDPKPQAKIKIEVNGEEKMWTMGKGATLASTYGQLVNLASHKGKLTDVEFNLVVKSDGKKNDYTIVL